MLELVLSTAVALVVVAFAEGYLPFGGKRFSPEVARKMVHVAHGLAAASWPFFVSMQTIIIVEVLFILAAVIARKFNLFRDLRSVYRLTWGEFFFPLGVIIVAFMNPDQWVFAAAMLHLGLADAAAAVVGTRFGKHSYHVFRHKKSLEGSLAFWVISILITWWVVAATPFGVNNIGLLLIVLPLLTTGIENLGVLGMDNLLIPIFVTAFLQANLINLIPT